MFYTDKITKPPDCRINLRSIETDYLIALISKDKDGLHILRAGLMKKLLIVQQRQQDQEVSYEQLFTEGAKLDPIKSVMKTTSDEQRVEDLMKAAMAGEPVSTEDKQWYRNRFGWDLTND